jgi:hypothetical protein
VGILLYVQCDFCGSKEVVGNPSDFNNKMPENWLEIHIRVNEQQNDYAVCPFHADKLIKAITSLVDVEDTGGIDAAVD